MNITASPEAVHTPVPYVLSVRGRHVHVQVTDVGLLWVGLQTLFDPERLAASQKRVWDKNESCFTKKHINNPKEKGRLQT